VHDQPEEVLILAHPHAAFLFLIVDGSSIYTSQSTRQWLTQRPQIVLVPLPSYAPRETLEGARSLSEVGQRLDRLAQQLWALERDGWQLQAPVEGDAVVLIRQDTAWAG
jgi:hypothetical protein